MIEREPSKTAKRMVTLAQIGQIATGKNGPACAYCGKRYDFANRPVGIENCCRNCLPAGAGDTEDAPKALRGWAPHVRAEHFLTAAEIMERSATEIESLRKRVAIAEHRVYFCERFHADGDLSECPSCGEATFSGETPAWLQGIVDAYQSEVADCSGQAMLTWSADLEVAVRSALVALNVYPLDEA